MWACPCCAAKIASRRAEELADVMAAVHRSGGCAYLVTYTMRHHQGQRLATLWDAVSAAWGAVTSGKAWVADQRGMLGWARVVEITHSRRSGWHVHVHALLAWSDDIDEDQAQRVAFRGWQRWDRALRRRGLDSTPVHGVDARRIRVGAEGLGDYFTKAAREVTAAYAKESTGGRTPFAILRDAVETYAADDVSLLWEWEQASHGRRQLTWSTTERMDLRRFAGLRREQTDEEIAAEDQGGDDMIALGPEAWDHISRAGQASELLDVAEIGGISGATAWLDRRGLPWAPARAADRRRSERFRPPRWTTEARTLLAKSEMVIRGGTRRRRRRA
ncbi:protein rep [Actinomycetospora sp. C-140]